MLQRRDSMENKKIFANQKMYMTKTEIETFLQAFQNKTMEHLIICPTAIYLPLFQKSHLQLGIQNVFYEDTGAYTGEISPLQVKEYHVSYAIIGHSERRMIFQESNEMLQKKIDACYKHQITPIFCIGETKEQYEMHKTNQVLKRQIFDVLKNVKQEALEHIIIAYEPLWAIGTGLVPSNEEIERITQYIKSIINQAFHVSVQVLYGGSVNENNIVELNQISNIDGFLVGGASKNSSKILKMYEVVVS